MERFGTFYNTLEVIAYASIAIGLGLYMPWESLLVTATIFVETLCSIHFLYWRLLW